MITLVSYSETVHQLPQTACLAFACGCAEHVFPLFDRLFKAQPLREAMDAAWGAVLSGPLSRVQQAALRKRVNAVVPNISEDPTLRAELGMNIGDLTVDVLECAAGETSVAERVGVGVLDALTVAIDALKHEDPGEWRKDLERPGRLHSTLREEYEQQLRMLGELQGWQDGRNALGWRATHRARGELILASLGFV
jgi:hypothetical protein